MSSKEPSFTTYIGDPSLLSFLNERSKDFKNRSDYIRKLILMDSNGLVAWEGEINRDLLIEKLNSLMEALGIQHEPSKIQRTLEIGEDVSVEEAINILTGEGIL